MLKFNSRKASPNMAALFAIRVVEGRTDFENVPKKLKSEVSDILEKEYGVPWLANK